MRIRHFLLAALLLAALALCGCGGKAAESEPIDLSDNPDTASGQGWSWVGGKDRTLTLEKANLVIRGDYGISLPDGSTVTCPGGAKNSLTVLGDRSAVGIRARAVLFLSGSGQLSLKVEASETVTGIDISDGKMSHYNMGLSFSAGECGAQSRGLVVGRSYVLNGGTLELAASSLCLSVGEDMECATAAVTLAGGGAGAEIGGELELANVTMDLSAGGTGLKVGELETSASTVTVTAGARALDARGDVEISSGTLTLTAGQEACYLENGELDLARGVNITVPEGGAFDGHTVCDPSGSPAKNVTFYKKP